MRLPEILPKQRSAWSSGAARGQPVIEVNCALWLVAAVLEVDISLLGSGVNLLDLRWVGGN